MWRSRPSPHYFQLRIIVTIHKIVILSLVIRVFHLIRRNSSVFTSSYERSDQKLRNDVRCILFFSFSKFFNWCSGGVRRRAAPRLVIAGIAYWRSTNVVRVSTRGGECVRCASPRCLSLSSVRCFIGISSDIYKKHIKITYIIINKNYLDHCIVVSTLIFVISIGIIYIE